MTLDAPGSTDPVLAAVAGHGVGSQDALPRTPLADGAWQALLHDVADQRLAGFLAAAIRDGAFAATDDQVKTTNALHMHGLALVLRLEQQLVELAQTFASRQIPFRLLKGSALANRFYPGTSIRLFCDLDVLVPSEHFDDAAATLLEGGAKRHYAEPRPGFDRRFSKGASFTTADGLAIDLHRTLVLGPFGLTVDLPSLFENPAHIRIATVDVATLNTETAFVHAAMHASLGDSPPRLVPLRDVAQIAFSDGFDADAALAIAERWQVRAPVAFAIRTAARTFDLPAHPLIEWAQSYTPHRREARALALYLGPKRNSQSLALASAQFVPGIRGKVAYLTSLALPRRDYLAERDGSYRARLQHAWKLVRDLRKRS